jgi:hypothetical protein
VASAILVELNIRLTVLVVETARLERRGVNDTSFPLAIRDFSTHTNTQKEKERAE